MTRTELDQVRGELEALVSARDGCSWSGAMLDHYRRLCARENELLKPRRFSVSAAV